MPWALIRLLGPYVLCLLLAASTWYYRTEMQMAELQLSFVEQVGKQVAKYNKGKENDWRRTVQEADARADAADRRHTNWLRDHKDSGSGLPKDTGTPVGTDRKGQICFDREGLDGALRSFVQGTTGLTAEGAAAVTDRRALIEAWPR